jgi:hypothetical protein
MVLKQVDAQAIKEVTARVPVSIRLWATEDLGAVRRPEDRGEGVQRRLVPKRRVVQE